MTEDAPDLDAGVRSNRRLTALVGLAMLVPLVVAFLSGLALDTFWRFHYFAGFLLVPLVALKLGTTGYRMASYYLGNPRYRRAGPPQPGLRLLAPVLVGATVVVLVSGIAMWLAGTRVQPWSTLHTDSAVVLAVAGGLHLLAHFRRATDEAAGEIARRDRPPLPPQARRRGALIAALAVGAVLAVVTIAPSTAPVHSHHDRGGLQIGTLGTPPNG